MERDGGLERQVSFSSLLAPNFIIRFSLNYYAKLRRKSTEWNEGFAGKIGHRLLTQKSVLEGGLLRIKVEGACKFVCSLGPSIPWSLVPSFPWSLGPCISKVVVMFEQRGKCHLGIFNRIRREAGRIGGFGLCPNSRHDEPVVRPVPLCNPRRQRHAQEFT